MGETPQALDEANAFEQRARNESSLEHLFTAVVLKGAALRYQERPTLRDLVETYYEAKDIVGQRSKGNRVSELVQNQRAELERELAKHLLTVACSRGSQPTRQDLLREALSHAKESVALAADKSTKLHSMEIQSRIELASGEIFNTQETLEAIDKLSPGGSYDVYAKRITEARIAARIGNPVEARKILLNVVSRTRATMSLHFHNIATQTLSQIKSC
jgi:hypothetical protein